MGRPVSPERLAMQIVLASTAVILLALAPILIAGHPALPELQRILGAAGYSRIQSTGYRFFGCADNDLFRQGFKALGPTGQPVSGVVCSAPLKGHTIRLD